MRFLFRNYVHLAWLAFGFLASLAAAETAPPPLVHRAAAPLGLPFFDVFTPKDYGGHTQVWGAAEDAAGLLYFGNFDGVLIYDGARWDRIDVPNATFVRGLAIDAHDVLWVAGVNELGYAAADATGRRTFVSLRDQLPAAARDFSELWRVVLTPRGPLFQSNTWLLRWDGDSFATLPLPTGNGWQLVRAGDTTFLSQAQHGWFAVRDSGAALALEKLERPAAFDNVAIMFALPGPAPGEYLLGTTRKALARWNGHEFVPFATEADEIFRTRVLYRGARLADGRMVLVSYQAGAFILDAHGRLLARLDDQAGLPGTAVLGVFAASDGAVWLSLQRGLVRIDARPWLTWFGAARGAPRSVMRPPLRFLGERYVTSDDGLFHLADATPSTPARLEAVPEVKDFLEGIQPEDDELIGYGDSIVSWRGPGKKIEPLPGRPNNVFEFYRSKTQPGRWFALRDGGLFTYRKAEDAWIEEGPQPELGHVRSMAEEDDGTWWIGTPNEGVLRVTFPDATATGPGKPRMVRFSTADGSLPEGHGWARVSLVGGRPLLRCERGLFRLDDTGKRWLPTEEFGRRFADGSSTTRSIEEVAEDGVWIAARPAGKAELVTNLELGIQGPRGWTPLRLPQLAALDDIMGMEYEKDTQVMWLGGYAGIVRLDLAAWRRAAAEPAPKLRLRSVQAAGRHEPLAGGWELPYGRRSLSVQFASPVLAADPGVRYESTLLGEGDPVVLTDGSPHREFSALASGNYVLRLRAHGSDGRWSEPVELAFAILPPWWRSGWAWACYGLLGLLAVIGLVRSRTQALRRRAEQLEVVVAARTEELRRSNAELVRLHQLELDEKIAARLAEEKARLEVLRYQLNPHFLFNALTSVCAELPVGSGGARAIIERLTDFCQLTLFRPANDESPTLGQEMKMLTAYLDIEKTRWGELLHVDIAVEPPAGDAKIPSLLLLPLVENALKYGQATTRDQLKIRLAAHIESRGANDANGQPGTLVIEIANTGQWVAPTERGIVPSLGIGHENLKQRLQRYYPGAHEFITEAKDGWVTVRLLLRAAPRE